MAIPDPPDELVEFFKQGRVIPFIGAGFSGAFDLPDWQGLLASLGDSVNDGLTFDQVLEYANGDYLQVAEYYYVQKGKYIGPLRHAIAEKLTTTTIDPTNSGHHVDLVNLGAPRIYTTNFDNLIEKTYSVLGQPHDVVVLPKDVASSAGATTQIVKYHGDLQYEESLVLTESSYYSRLDFESPMDLKFRADLLGRAVLFLGYSLRDINIRVIWFKLLDMMKGVAPEDRPTSYIVLMKPNQVVETLYKAVGITSIILDPDGAADTNEKRSKLLNEFVLKLANEVCIDGQIPGAQGNFAFASTTLFDAFDEELERESDERPFRRRQPRSLRALSPALGGLFQTLKTRQIPSNLSKRLDEVISKSLAAFDAPVAPQQRSDVTSAAAALLKIRPGSRAAADALTLASTWVSGRYAIRDSDVQVAGLWHRPLGAEVGQLLLIRADDEVSLHEDGDFFDDDLFWVADLLIRIKNKQITIAKPPPDFDEQVATMLDGCIRCTQAWKPTNLPPIRSMIWNRSRVKAKQRLIRDRTKKRTISVRLPWRSPTR